MRVLGWLIKKNRGWVILALLAAILSNGSQIAFMFFVGELVNQIEGRSKIELSFFLLMGVFLLSNAATQFLYQLTGRFAREREGAPKDRGEFPLQRLLWKPGLPIASLCGK